MNDVTRKTVMTYITENKIANFLPTVDWLEEHYGLSAQIYGGEKNTFGERKILDVKWIEVAGVKGARDVRTMLVQPGVTLLYGPNDSGKSTYLDALVFALSKRTYRGTSAPEDLITRGLEKAIVQVCLEGEKDIDYVRRSVATRVMKKGKKVGSTEVIYDLAVTLGGAESTTPADAEANLSLYLGQPFDMLRRCFLVGQGQLDALLDEQPGKRQEIFFKMLALEPCEATRKKLSEILKAAEEDVGTNLTNAMALKLEIAADKRKIEELGDLEAASQRLTVLDKQLKEAEKYTAQADAVVATKQAQGERLELLKNNLAFCNELRAKRKQMEGLEDVSGDDGSGALEALSLRVSALVEKGAALVARRDFIKEQGIALKTAPLECPVCAAMGKTCAVTPEQRALRRAELLAVYKSLDAEADAVREEWRQAAREKHEHEQEMKEHQKSQAAYASADDAIAHIDAELKRVNVTQQMVDKAQAEYDQTVSIARPEGQDNEGVFSEAKDIRQRLDEAVRLASNVKEKKEKLAEAEKRSGEDAQTWLTRIRAVLFAFQKDGIPLWIVRKHLGEINTYARDLCEGDRYQYGFAEDLSILIFDNENGESAEEDRPVHPALASGSSRQRAALVLQAALARWQCRMNGVQPQLFWIDELPFQNEEQHGAQCVALIKRLTQWFPKVVLAASNWGPYAGKFDHEVALLGKPIDTRVPNYAPPPGKYPSDVVPVPKLSDVIPVKYEEIEEDVAIPAKRKRRTKAEMEAARQAESVNAEVLAEAHRENQIMGTEPPRLESPVPTPKANQVSGVTYPDDGYLTPNLARAQEMAAEDDEPF